MRSVDSHVAADMETKWVPEQNMGKGNELHCRVASHPTSFHPNQKTNAQTQGEASASGDQTAESVKTESQVTHLLGKCPRDHQLVQLTPNYTMICDKCNKQWPKGTISHMLQVRLR